MRSGERVRSVVLAAGAGRRMGRPKILVEDWLERAVRALAAHGLPVTVVVGAQADAARAEVDRVAGVLGVPLEVVEAEDWDAGMGRSLRAAIRAASAGDDLALLVTLVDLPDVDERVVGRLLDGAGGAGPDGAGPDRTGSGGVGGLPGADGSDGAGGLRRAAYAGKPGHPVLIGRDHWDGVAASAEGDRGARAYLATHDVELVECGDLASGEDVDSLSGPAGS